MSLEHLLSVIKIVSIGTAVTLLPMIFIIKWYGIKFFKLPLIALFTAVIGTTGTYVWFFIENGYFKGISFFGAVFFIPISFMIGTYMFKEKTLDILDVVAPGVSIMLFIMKLWCLKEGCCGGRLLKISNFWFEFPSQIVEGINGLVLMTVILIIGHKMRYRGKLYPLLMIMYGVTRFILNFFRQEYADHIGLLPPNGTIWSILSIIIGIVWIIGINKWRQKHLSFLQIST